ncbi:zf-HC2 domain-containing protein [Robertmurraya massiliosenegalensis]|uniref:zf-HC2 domain-containing protein n=1 Tax=Robertmurraya massiliosenegalensis TaxID=1287657 RepID=UPI0002F7091E|nr:zf-HC2 domain-containing protein [Robertmurraya massiliosenegalensis]
MNKKEECAIFQDLYELYVDEEVEEETKSWMREHEKKCPYCHNGWNKRDDVLVDDEESDKIWGIRLMTMLMYSLFSFLSIWMSIWYWW